MDRVLTGFRVLVTQAFLHPLADSGKQAGAGKCAFFLRHHSRLPHLRPEGEEGVAGDPVVHGGSLHDGPHDARGFCGKRGLVEIRPPDIIPR